MRAANKLGLIYAILAASAAWTSLSNTTSAATTVVHLRVSETDEATLAAGTVPGVAPSPDGTVAAGTLELSDDVPVASVPADAGNRSLSFTGTQLVTIPGTQQLSHAAVIAEGGFTYETWFKWDGGGTLNAMIDYAGTEKFRILSETGMLDFNFDSGSGLQDLATPTQGEWHYVAAVFEHDGEPVDADFKIHGQFTWYFDSIEVAGTVAATKDDFGDSLNRTIGIGGHPLGFGADFVNALLYEPRVTLGALGASELLFGDGGGGFEITKFAYDNNPEAPTTTITWTSKPTKQYSIEFSTDLKTWSEAADEQGAAGESETTAVHQFIPGYPELVGAERIYYRVLEL